MHRPTNESSSHTKTRSVWPTLQVKIARRKKWAWPRGCIFKPTEAHAAYGMLAHNVLFQFRNVCAQTNGVVTSVLVFLYILFQTDADSYYSVFRNSSIKTIMLLNFTPIMINFCGRGLKRNGENWTVFDRLAPNFNCRFTVPIADYQEPEIASVGNLRYLLVNLCFVCKAMRPKSKCP